MTPEQAQAALPLIVALAEGKELEYNTHNSVDGWKSIGTQPSLPWLFEHPEHYRIKKEPKVFYGIQYADGRVAVFSSEENRDHIWSLDKNRIADGQRKIDLGEKLP